MNRWLRRFLYLFATLVWLIVMSFPLLAFLLATQEQIQLGSSPRSHLRLFLLQEEEAGGVGVEWARPLRRQPTCSQTSVTYLLWDGAGENVSYCQCYDDVTGDPLPADLQSCQLP